MAQKSLKTGLVVAALAALMWIPDTAQAASQNATFTKGKVIQNAMVNGTTGIEVAHRIRVRGMVGKQMEVACYFYDAVSKKPLKDQNGQYRSNTGTVSVGQKVKVLYPRADFKEFKLFLPNSELHVRNGTFKLKVNCEAFDNGRSIGRSYFQKFTYSNGMVARSAKFGQGRIVHNVRQGRFTGLEVTHPLDVYSMHRRKLEVACFFYLANGTPLRDMNRKYRSSDGSVSVGQKVLVKYPTASFKAFKLFIPYDELHLGRGTAQVKVRCEGFDKSTSIGSSAWLSFEYRQ